MLSHLINVAQQEWKKLALACLLKTGPCGFERTSIDRQEDGVEMQIRVKYFLWIRTALATAALAGTLALISAPAVRADNQRDCQRRIARADRRVHQAVQRYGWQSRQADNARYQLRQEREYCWSHVHRWWDEDGRRWRTDRDWNDHDHDHERDHDHP